MAGVLTSCHSPATAQIILSSVKPLLLFFVNCGNCFHALLNETLLQPFNILYHSKSVPILLKMNFSTLYDFGYKFTFLLLVFHKSVEPKRCFGSSGWFYQPQLIRDSKTAMHHFYDINDRKNNLYNILNKYSSTSLSVSFHTSVYNHKMQWAVPKLCSHRTACFSKQTKIITSIIYFIT